MTEINQQHKLASTVIKVNKSLCFGCGLCARDCPAQAIYVHDRLALIDRLKCTGCGVCIDICPRAAIIQIMPVSKDELQTTVTLLKQQTSQLIQRIENMRIKSSRIRNHIQ